MKINFENLIANRAKFYGVSGTSFKLGSLVFNVIEDKEDGYRSSMSSVEVYEDSPLIFQENSLALITIKMEYTADFSGYQLVDVDNGNCWLRFGTDNGDSYYPEFIFEYTEHRENVFDLRKKETIELENIRKKILD